ncbi:MAG: RNA polymerase factor sigma-54, partial [Pseudomonadales bacterium 32-61-5]
MKASLVLKMGQQLTMTPQLQQAIRLLQLSTLDLQQEIQEALDSNPMLEREEDGDDFDNPDPMAESLDKKAESAPTEHSSSDSQYEEPINT